MHLTVLLLYQLSYCCKQQAGLEPAARRPAAGDPKSKYHAFTALFQFLEIKERQSIQGGGSL